MNGYRVEYTNFSEGIDYMTGDYIAEPSPIRYVKVRLDRDQIFETMRGGKLFGDTDISTSTATWSGTTTRQLYYAATHEGGWANVSNVWVEYPNPPRAATPQERLRRMLRDRSGPAIVAGTRSVLPPTTDERELRARDTLRSFVGEERWRRFLRDGFITVHSHADQRSYQIFPGINYENITRVYRRGVMEERLCCYLKGGFPPTDHLLMRFLLVLNSPAEFRKLCIRHDPMLATVSPPPAVADGSLPETFRRMKEVA